MKKERKMEFEEDFTKTMEVLTWKAIMIDWRQGLKSPTVERSILKLAFQQAQAHYERCNEEEVMADFPRQRIVGGDLAALTLRDYFE